MRTICAAKLALIALLALGLPAAAAKPLAHLRAEAVVKGTVIKLGEVAKLEGDPATRDRLAAVELGPSPLAGQSRGIGADYVRIRLRQQGFDSAVLAQDSAPRCQISRACQKVSEDRLVEIARNFLEGQIEPGDGRLVIEPTTRPREMVLPSGQLELSAEASGTATGVMRRVVVRAMVDGESAGRAEISLRIHRYVKVAVASAGIPRGEMLSADRVSFEERDRMSLPDDVIVEGESIEGLQALQVIAPGAAITHRIAAVPAVVHRGDTVTVQAQTGSICVTITGVASEDGRIGETIRVRNSSSNQEFRARVVDAKTVVVTL